MQESKLKVTKVISFAENLPGLKERICSICEEERWGQIFFFKTSPLREERQVLSDQHCLLWGCIKGVVEEEYLVIIMG